MDYHWIDYELKTGWNIEIIRTNNAMKTCKVICLTIVELPNNVSTDEKNTIGHC